MTGPDRDANRRTYETEEVAAHYAALDYLTPCERLLFQNYISPGAAILDLGVGGGRTTPLLVSRASRYVGVDYAAAMIKACCEKFPGLEFVAADAADLSQFPDASFDAVVFAFNGIDYVLPDERRRSCLGHIHRILRPRGVLIFSSHNPRSVVLRPSWNGDRLRTLARRWSAGSNTFYRLLWTLLTFVRATFAVCRSFGVTLVRLLRRLPSRMFWCGEGTQWDPVHGGLVTHYSIPECVVGESGEFHLRPVRILGNEYPAGSHPYMTDWYYYVFTKACEK